MEIVNQYKFLFDQERAGVKCSEFIKVLNKEGLQFFGGYTPLYKQPLYQQRKLFKHGYPWSAPENKSLCATYNDGSCPVAENHTGSWRCISGGGIGCTHQSG